MSLILNKPFHLHTASFLVALGAILLWPSAAHAGPDVGFTVQTPLLAVSNASNIRVSNQRRYRNFGSRNRNFGLRNRNFRSHGFRSNRFRSNRYRGNNFRNNGLFLQFSPGFSSGSRFNGSYYNGSRLGGSSCRSVSKEGYWDGAPALIGGLQCFDSYGQAYIAPDSRHLIRYY